MNSINSYILSIYQVALIVRDSLEYTLKNHKASDKVYLERKKAFATLLQENSPLMSFIANNGEKSVKFKENLFAFQSYVFGDSDSIVKLAGEQVQTDKARHLQIYESAIGVYQTVLDIIYGYQKYAFEQKAFEQQMADLLDADEFMFRVTSHLVLTDEIFERFSEFQKVMRENNGQPGPLANFVVEDMKKINGLIFFEKTHNKIKDYRYNAMADKVIVLIELMEGKRQLEPGKTFPQTFQETRLAITSLLPEVETRWRTVFKTVMDDAVAWSQKLQEKKENLA